MEKGLKLHQSFYRDDNVVKVARELLGKVLVTDIGGYFTSGIIVETEAYAGITDKASHAYNGRRTGRTEVIYREGGVAYVYLCYGIHYLFNIVTHTQDVPHAVLIRAAEPLDGIPAMLQRRGKTRPELALMRGPGSLSKALGIDKELNGCSLEGPEIWVEDREIKVPVKAILSGPRIGVDYAGADALLPYRFWIKDNPHVSGNGVKKSLPPK
jgi:DNA-3-methyladenine glycosylase